jgi:mono/diheme cytochrome c family protein
MKSILFTTLISLTLAGAHTISAQDGTTPADVYFAMAVTENSHNHYGENLLYLDFQERPNTSKIAPRVIISPRIEPGSITIDGKIVDWNPTYLTEVWGRVMNNYPLSEFYDAVPGPIIVGSSWDDQYVYFLVQWEDANHDASTYRNLWVFDGEKWKKKEHLLVNEGTPAAAAINRTDKLTGSESEDRIFFMFPIRDMQRNFRDGGLGCAAYCHANLETGGPLDETMIAEDVAAMHTNVPGDMADVWHWTSTRSLPSLTLKDGHLVYGLGEYNGRKADRGNAPTVNNDSKKLGVSGSRQPVYMSLTDHLAGNYGSPNQDKTMFEQHDAVPIQDAGFVEGDTIPYSISRPSTGSRGDVTAVATFDDSTHMWTLEIKRLLNTGDGEDFQFVAGTGAPAPNNPAAIVGDAERGEQLYKTHGCVACHQDKGQGQYDGKWVFPRIQRASGGSIYKTVLLNREMRGAVRSFIEEEMKKSRQLIMPDIHLSEQEAEDIAAWLQTQFIPLGK